MNSCIEAELVSCRGSDHTALKCSQFGTRKPHFIRSVYSICSVTSAAYSINSGAITVKHHLLSVTKAKVKLYLYVLLIKGIAEEADQEQGFREVTTASFTPEVKKKEKKVEGGAHVHMFIQRHHYGNLCKTMRGGRESHVGYIRACFLAQRKWD